MKKKCQRMYVVLEPITDYEHPRNSRVCLKGVFAKRADANKYVKRLNKALRDGAIKAWIIQGWNRDVAEERVDEAFAECAETYSVMSVPLEPEEARP